MAYATQADIEAVFGPKNVEKWADLDHSGSEAAITARITAALAYAEGYIDDRLRGGPFEIPITASVPVTITDCTAKVAGLWLYESRGAVDFNPASEGDPEDRFSFMRKQIDHWLKLVKRGAIRLNLTLRTHVPEVGSHEFTDN